MADPTRKALIVGIDYYTTIGSLFGCVNDANSVADVLAFHSDDARNFDVMLLTGTGPNEPVTRAALKKAVRELFDDDSEIALFYFAGHGHNESTGGYLCTSECETGDDGLALDEVLTLANQSKARNKAILLDSCHSGIAGTRPLAPQIAELTEGMTILTASTAEQYATEDEGSGIFTRLLVDALGGAAGDLVGNVTPGSVYAHIDQSLGAWEQRPVFKTNVKSFVSLRKVQPSIGLAELRQILEFFPKQGSEFKLDPSFEPERSTPPDPAIPPPNPENNRRFAILQRYNRVNLVVPVDAPHMWHAAMGSKSCKLTILGEHYRRLIERGRI
ncbi:MAG TPA: caspase family protein [Chthoniobacterales bacterium]|nr:caspase family protein [Chthoniobacterales bacterium]